MKLKVCLGVALVSLFAFSAVADHHATADHQEKKAAAPMDPAMMEAMMRAATPGEAHKKLDGMVGTWNTDIKMWMMPGADPMTSSGTSENRWVLGGRYIEQRFTGNFMGMPFEGVGMTGYDNIKKQYIGAWADNMSTAMMTSTGKLADDGKTWMFSSVSPDPMTGKDMKVEEKVVVIDADHHMMEMWMPAPDGKMFKSMEIHYTRKK